jgi:lipid-A-disaccharide synthase
VGEKSGDHHAANLIHQLKLIRPEIEFDGFGGDEMRAAGCRVLADTIHLASMGLSFLSNLFSFLRLIWSFHRRLREEPPECLVLVDFPGFNFLLARMAKWSQIPVVYYICPQIWAWAPWRRDKILDLTDLLMVILPFEEDFYREPGKRVVYVGHPLADELMAMPSPETLEARLRRGFDVADEARILGLFPGSRNHEVQELLPLFRRTLEKMDLRRGPVRLMVSSCRAEFRPWIEKAFAGFPLPIEIIDGDAYPLMASCHLALVASGTATLELAYFHKPMVVFYKIGRLAHRVYRRICTSPFVSLVNILGKEEVVPEEVTCEDNSSRQALRAQALFESSAARQTCLQKLERLRQEFFRPGGTRRAAQVLAEFLDGLEARPDRALPEAARSDG